MSSERKSHHALQRRRTRTRSSSCSSKVYQDVAGAQLLERVVAATEDDESAMNCISTIATGKITSTISEVGEHGFEHCRPLIAAYESSKQSKKRRFVNVLIKISNSYYNTSARKVCSEQGIDIDIETHSSKILVKDTRSKKSADVTSNKGGEGSELSLDEITWLSERQSESIVDANLAVNKKLLKKGPHKKIIDDSSSIDQTDEDDSDFDESSRPWSKGKRNDIKSKGIHKDEEINDSNGRKKKEYSIDNDTPKDFFPDKSIQEKIVDSNRGKSITIEKENGSSVINKRMEKRVPKKAGAIPKKVSNCTNKTKSLLMNMPIPKSNSSEKSKHMSSYEDKKTIVENIYQSSSAQKPPPNDVSSDNFRKKTPNKSSLHEDKVTISHRDNDLPNSLLPKVESKIINSELQSASKRLNLKVDLHSSIPSFKGLEHVMNSIIGRKGNNEDHTISKLPQEHANTGYTIDMNGSFLPESPNDTFDFYDLDTPKLKIIEHKIPIFPEDFLNSGHNNDDLPLSWWGIVEPPKEILELHSK
mmetsp:Transcript_19364/g.27228  ORF Transcript_19364/g.27228 Transcript_19364/m.27228 type:complete len:531 (+) Transcript_19364:109-1701(+)